METARANIVVDTAFQENRGEGEDSYTYGEATFHAVGRLSLAEDGFHDYDASTPGSVKAVFMQPPQKTIQIGERFKI